ncbi:S8 family peptidase [Peribacillus frigoritolerans]
MKQIKQIVFSLLILFIWLLFVILTFNESDSAKNDLKEHNEKIYNLWGQEYIGELEDVKSSKIIRVAILDSGIDKTHKEFKGLNFKEYNAITPTKPIIDELGHGTAVTGIIASKGIEISGITRKLELYDVKVLNEKGTGEIENVIQGIEWCIQQDVDVINISFGFSSNQESLKNVINKALGANIVIVAASGNTLGLSVDYPAKYDGVLSISSFDESLKLDPLSAKGKIDFSAPGVNIVSTNNLGGYSNFSGTSYATAFATGAIAALMIRDSAFLDNENIKLSLRNHVIDLGKKGYDDHFGFGVITLKKEIR